MMKKPQSQQKEVRAKVNSGINRNQPKKVEPQKRIMSAVQSHSGEKSVQSEHQSENQFKHLNDKLNNIIQDYLVRNNCLKTLELFEQEIQFSSETENQQEAVILAHFDRGERDAFLTSWSRYIPINLRSDHEAWKLEFYIQIYFLIYPIHPYSQKKGYIDKQAINAFKAFLDSKGSDLSKTNEVLPFYALPYVKNPQSHQTFAHLFTHEWVINLRDRLKIQIQQIYGSEQNGSLLKRLFLGQQQGNDTKLLDYAEKIEENLRIYEAQNYELKKKIEQQTTAIQQVHEHAQHNLIESQQKWFSFTRDLMNLSTQLLHNLNNPQVVNQVKKKIQQYERFLSQNLDDLMSQSQDISLFEKESLQEQEPSNVTSHQQVHIPVQQSIEEYLPLDYSKIIRLFTTSTNETFVASVLQALRWRITRARSALERRSVVVAYATHDIIGTHQRNILLAQYLILKAHQKISCQTIKLLNALASDYSGRTYLTSNPKLIQFLVEIVKKENIDSAKRKNAIGALQKLSLRKQSQIWMLDNDIIYHTLKILKNEKSNLSEYTYEYITALIMNLSLSSRGKDALSLNKELVFEVLFELIEYPNDQIRTFTNGTFYSIFSRRELREYAYYLNIPQELPRLLINTDERFKKQIQYMIKQLEAPEEEDLESSQMEEDNDVDDIDEDEEQVVDEDDEEDLENNDIIIGEELLRREFGLEGDEAQNQKNIMKSIVLKEYQQRSQIHDQLRESDIEKMSVGQLAQYDMITQPSKNQSFRKQGRQDPAFVSRPKIPRTPPIGQPQQ